MSLVVMQPQRPLLSDRPSTANSARKRRRSRLASTSRSVSGRSAKATLWIVRASPAARAARVRHAHGGQGSAATSSARTTATRTPTGQRVWTQRVRWRARSSRSRARLRRAARPPRSCLCPRRRGEREREIGRTRHCHRQRGERRHARRRSRCRALPQTIQPHRSGGESRVPTHPMTMRSSSWTTIAMMKAMKTTTTTKPGINRTSTAVEAPPLRRPSRTTPLSSFGSWKHQW